MLEKIEKLSNDIKNMQKEINLVEKEMLEILNEMKIDDEVLNYIYWETDLSLKQLSQISNIGQAKLYQHIQDKNVTIICPKCQVKWIEKVSSRNELKKKKKVRPCQKCGGLI
ncbi:hypothetical protein [Dethiothermospora halolimnae]|uniref:hypothetical protein n=1 Tax=Dethiothermospora halolimnae TaxID=3114390 RepID=UPI003CCC131B